MAGRDRARGLRRPWPRSGGARRHLRGDGLRAGARSASLGHLRRALAGGGRNGCSEGAVAGGSGRGRGARDAGRVGRARGLGARPLGARAFRRPPDRDQDRRARRFGSGLRDRRGRGRRALPGRLLRAGRRDRRHAGARPDAQALLGAVRGRRVRAAGRRARGRRGPRLRHDDHRAGGRERGGGPEGHGDGGSVRQGAQAVRPPDRGLSGGFAQLRADAARGGGCAVGDLLGGLGPRPRA